MSEPRSRDATCFHCQKKIRWKAQTLSQQQKEENAVVEEFNKGKMSYDRKPTPHRPYFTPRWTHVPESDGEDKAYCELENPEVEKPLWRKPRAQPNEFCNARNYGDGTDCNLTARPKEEWSIYTTVPKCGRHLKEDIEQYTQKQAAEEKVELEAWARQHVEQLGKTLKETYGVNWTYERRFSEYTGKIVVDPAEILEILEKRRQ